MKKSKWLKWQIGAAITLGIAALFQTVKSSSMFESKIADASATKTPNVDIQTQDDDVVNEWQNERQQGSAGDFDSDQSFRRQRGRHFRGRDDQFFGGDGGQMGGSGSSPSDQGQSGGGSYNGGPADNGSSFDNGGSSSSGSDSLGGGQRGGFDSSTGRS